MDCPICWDELEDSAFSLNCGHLFHRKCIEPLVNTRLDHLVCPLCRKKSSKTFHTNYIREVFFASANSTSEHSAAEPSTALDEACKEDPVAKQALDRLRNQNECLRADKLKERQQHDTATQKFEEEVREVLEGMKGGMDALIARVTQLRSERHHWKRCAKTLDKEVLNLEMELYELGKIRHMRDESKKTRGEVSDENMEGRGVESLDVNR